MDINERYIESLLNDPLLADKAILLSGPRQVGKTYTARKWLKETNNENLYYNWDSEKIRRIFRRDPNFFESDARQKTHPRVVLDEIHKLSNWKNVLKGYLDTMDFRFLVTGSARLKYFQRSGDSMFGRYHLLHLWPLTPFEILIAEYSPNINPHTSLARLESEPASNDLIDSMLEYSGFPEPFLKQNKRSLNLWHREYDRRIIREDIRDLTKIAEVSRFEHLVEILPLKIGAPLSLNSLKEDLFCSYDAVKTMTKALDKLFITLTVRPFSKKIKYAISKEPKIYFVDWSRIKDEGVRFENFIAVQLKTYCDYVTDAGWSDMDLHYIRDKQKRETDFLITKDGMPIILIEAKLSEEHLDKNLEYFAGLLGGIPAVQVVKREGVFRKFRSDLQAVSVNRFFNLFWKGPGPDS